MQRALGLLLAILVAAAVAYVVVRPSGSSDEASAPIEKLLAAGRIAEARTELAAARPHLDAATAGYLDGLILLADAKDAEAAAVLTTARAARPGDWRITSALSAALANSGKFPEAVAQLEAYVTLAPADERGLFTLAKFLLDAKRGTPDPAKALELLARVDALPQRVASASDPTSVSAAQIHRLRTEALIRLGRGMEALLSARDGTKESPQDADAWYLLGEAARRSGLGPESVDAYRRAAQLAPASRRFLEQYALAMIEFGGDGHEILDVAEALLATSPRDPSLLVLKARALVRAADPRVEADGRLMEGAATIYRDLLKRDDVPPNVKQDVRRNLAVLLYDWKVGGRPGDYLDEAWGLLKEYVRLGGAIDDAIRPTFQELEERDRKSKEKR